MIKKHEDLLLKLRSGLLYAHELSSSEIAMARQLVELKKLKIEYGSWSGKKYFATNYEKYNE